MCPFPAVPGAKPLHVAVPLVPTRPREAGSLQPAFTVRPLGAQSAQVICPGSSYKQRQNRDLDPRNVIPGLSLSHFPTAATSVTTATTTTTTIITTPVVPTTTIVTNTTTGRITTENNRVEIQTEGRDLS